MLKQRALLFAAAAVAGAGFNALSIPIPFMLGGIVAAFVAKTFVDHSVSWPMGWRNLMVGVAGYGIGCNCSMNTLVRFSEQFVGGVTAILVTLAASIAVAVFMHHHSRANLVSCVLACMPGGMTQVLLLVEEDGRADPNVVTVGQTLRLVCVVVSVPFLAMHLFTAAPAEAVATHAAGASVHWLALVPVALLGQWLAKKAHMPTSQLLGPVLLTSAVSVAITPLVLQKPPSLVLAIAQANIGLYIGASLDRDKLLESRAVVPQIIAGSYVMIAAGLLMSQLLAGWYDFSAVTSFLALAPGGIAEMCMAGLGMGADVDLILTYQLIRILFLSTAIPYIVRLCFKEGQST